MSPTLADALASVARGEPARVAVVADGCRFTYADLDGEVTRLAAGLSRLGVRGGRVLLLLPTGWDAVCWIFAVARAGAVSVPLNPRIRARELVSILEDVRANLVVASPGVRGNDLVALLS